MPQTQPLDFADQRDGFISGVASTPSVDSYGHKVLPHAFDRSIKSRGLSGSQGVKLLASHGGMPVGRISRLETMRDELRIEAELNLDIPHVRDLHSAIKHSGGLSFSVGFTLEDFDFVDDAKSGEPWLVIKSGDLLEVSVVTFPACASATMDFAKSMSVTPAHEALLARIASVRTAIADLRRIYAHD